MERWTERPIPGGNSIGWLMWHLARWQDVAVNTIVRGEQQVFFCDGWDGRLGVSDTRAGTGFTDEEVEDWCSAVCVSELPNYWAAVARETHAWLSSVDLDVLEEVPDVDARLAAAPDVVSESAAWVHSYFRGRPARFYVGFTAINHAYMHIGEMAAVRGALGVAGL